ncbi:MAG TPA: hypothetical protein VF516_11785 [Kofleriaceae bacterium]
MKTKQPAPHRPASEPVASPFESIDAGQLDAITGGCACGCGQASCSCTSGSCGQGARTTTTTPANPYQFQYRWGR